MDYLEIKNLSFQYAGSEQKCLDDISLSITKGDFVLICGASGSGKTTLLKMLKPQLSPAGIKTGDIYLDQKNLTLVSEHFSSSKIGYVMQNPENQIITDTVWHELAFGLENLGLSSFEIKGRIAEMANFLGIQELMDTRTADLSGGQKQLLNLASVLVMQPDMLILDEPTTQLDPIAAQNFVDVLVRLNREMGLTILLAEHGLESVFALADKVVLLDQGQLIFAEEPRAVSAAITTKTQGIDRFLLSLPSALQIYHALALKDQVPLTVIEGKRFLARHFSKSSQPTLEKKELSKTQKTSLELKNCWFRYEKNGSDILAGVDMTLNEGEIFSLVGANGTGKTTLLKVIASIHHCYRGKLTLFQQAIKKSQHKIGYLPQSPEMVFVKDSVLEDYQNYLQGQGLDEKQQLEKIVSIAALLDMTDKLKQHPFDLSGGECQRAALGKVLLADPSVLLLDEPTKGIDNYAKKQLIQLLKELAGKGKTILVVTHDLDFAAELSDRCGLFFQHNLLTTANPKEFFSKHAFYTTAASRISRDVVTEKVTTEQVITACQAEEGVTKNDF
ncbi:ABC transporter ATP-binding protein [Enterococcus termitis]|uniref:ABC transporter domain-containing protein n=1 Tax=Enterococcus termitis TaxID=332950 RepID=A0A1E5H743_9ENTE|nr:ABC transporter ATP-binding protein [Enterococcus termitis]OEG20741.1 hypothetical protein BCR25_02695 [Enterococcus termitis]